MSMDFDRTGSDKPITEQEGVMFAAQPVWERNRKRRGFGGRKTAAAAPAMTVTPEPRSFAAEPDYEEPMALDTPLDRPLDRPVDRAIDLPLTDDYGRTVPPSTLAAEPVVERDAGLVAPIGRPSTRSDRGPKSKGMGPAAIAAGVVTLGAIGAVGWFASRDNDGIPELAPGQPTTSQVATAPLPPADMPTTTPVPAQTAAVNPPAATPARATVRTAPAERRMAQARTRPAAAAAPSAGDTGVNASTTTAIPSGPQPYSTLNPGATPAPVNPTPTPASPPTQAAPPPAENPAAIPATPPTLPTETPPTESPVTPPTS